MKALRAVNGTNFSWDWDKLIPKDAGIDQIYIDTLIDQINGGMYEKLFVGRGSNLNWPPAQDQVFLDVGANLGLVSIYASPVCKRIVAIEPAPNAFPILKELTRPFANIETWNVALASQDAEHEFFINDINFTASSTDNTYGYKTYVTGLKLETILKEKQLNHVDVCKIDVEGAEGEALDYYQIENAKDIIKTYFIEFHNCPKTSWEHKLGSAVANFLRCGYQSMEVRGMSLVVRR